MCVACDNFATNIQHPLKLRCMPYNLRIVYLGKYILAGQIVMSINSRFHAKITSCNIKMEKLFFEKRKR